MPILAAFILHIIAAELYQKHKAVEDYHNTKSNNGKYFALVLNIYVFLFLVEKVETNKHLEQPFYLLTKVWKYGENVRWRISNRVTT